MCLERVALNLCRRRQNSLTHSSSTQTPIVVSTGTAKHILEVQDDEIRVMASRSSTGGGGTRLLASIPSIRHCIDSVSAYAIIATIW
jgi:hypothetical protein